MTRAKHPHKGHVFVVTYGRSGSTLIQAVLNAIPGYLIRGENNNALLGLYKSWRALVRSPDIARMLREARASGPDHPWFGAEAIDSDAYRASLCATFTQYVLRPDATTKVCGFKEIRTLADPGAFADYLGFLQTGFPNTRIIFNTRDAEDVCRSSWWRRHDPQEVKAMVTAADSVFRAHVADNPGRAVLLRYEDYTVDHTALEPLFALLGDRPDEAALRAIMARRLTHAT